jgi:hypothetical protein
VADRRLCIERDLIIRSIAVCAFFIVGFGLFWFVANLLAFLGTPIGLVWGWYGWTKRRQHQPLHIARIELAAILSATLGPVVFAMAKFLPNTLERIAGRTRLALSFLGIVLSFAISWQTVVATCLMAVGGVMLVFGLTQP